MRTGAYRAAQATVSGRWARRARVRELKAKSSGAVASTCDQQVLRVEPEDSPYKLVEAQTAQDPALFLAGDAQLLVICGSHGRPWLPRRGGLFLS